MTKTLAMLCSLLSLPALAAEPTRTLEAKLEIADTLYRDGRRTDAYAAYQDVVDEYRLLVEKKAPVDGAGLSAAAKSAFLLLEPKHEEYDSIRFDDFKTLAADIRKRILLFKPLREDYERVILDYKHAEWTVAALHQIAKLGEDLLTAVNASPAPIELTDNQEQMYRQELSEQFGPVKDTAVHYYSKCLETAAEHGIDTDYSRRAKEALERMRR